MRTTLLSLLGLVLTATVGQVWYTLTPDARAASTDMETLKGEAKYIRERVDQIYDEVRKEDNY